MSEHEVHVDAHDSYGKKVGALAACLAVLLSIFTISAHRAHTETIVMQNNANDIWAQYQAKRIRDYQLEMNSDLLRLVASTNPALPATVAGYDKKRAEYKNELMELKTDADEHQKDSLLFQRKASYFDFAEGVLEISLVMSSLYFLSKKKMFPRFGMLFGLIGAIVGFFGFMLT